MHWSDFDAEWIVDTEFTCPDGHRPDPICLVAHEIRSGQTQRWWADDLRRRRTPPFGTGPRELVVAYFATAEIGCYLALDWPAPPHLVDLYVEYRALTNDGEPRGRSMLDACACFGVSTLDAAEKAEHRALAIRGGPYTAEERKALLDYCASDVRAESALFTRMRSLIDLPRALLRGRSMVAFARVERIGVPIDVRRLRQLQASWADVKRGLVAAVDREYRVYDDALVFKRDRFERYLVTHNIPWPRLDSGELSLTDEVFRDRAKAFPQLHPLRELRATQSDLRLGELAIGPDDRNRVLLSPFGSKTSRCTPSSGKFIFGPSTWIRHLIRPEPGTGLAYIDWSQQEFAISAVLSKDRALQRSYESSDPYWEFARLAGACPPGATATSHPHIREQFKVCALGVLYGMAAESLALRLGQSVAYGERLLRAHRRAYPAYWRWAAAAVLYGTAYGRLQSVFGWPLRVTATTKARTLANFPVQSAGAEMLRLSLIKLTAAGVRVCAPVHDAVLIEAPFAELADTVATAQRLMTEASAIVLDGFRLRTDAMLIRDPDRYTDSRGAALWRHLNALVPEGGPTPRVAADGVPDAARGLLCAGVTTA